MKTTYVSVGLATIPFVGICFSVPLWDRVLPMVFGLFPGVFLGLFWKRTSSVAVLAGLVRNLHYCFIDDYTSRSAFWYGGFLELCFNLATTIVLSLIMPSSRGFRSIDTQSANSFTVGAGY
jgi:Na+/proline symporter